MTKLIKIPEGYPGYRQDQEGTRPVEVAKWKAIAISASEHEDQAEKEVERLDVLILSCRQQIKADKVEVERLRDWMDNNFTHCEPGAVPVLGSVSKRIWYHATDDTESYPFSEVVCKVLDDG